MFPGDLLNISLYFFLFCMTFTTSLSSFLLFFPLSRVTTFLACFVISSCHPLLQTLSSLSLFPPFFFNYLSCLYVAVYSLHIYNFACYISYFILLCFVIYFPEDSFLGLLVFFHCFLLKSIFFMHT